MGQCINRGKLSPEEKRDRLIQKQMRKAREEEGFKVKLLLLGAGESGKSTLFKQMKLLYSEQKDFSMTDREKFKAIVFSNIVSDIQAMIKSVNLVAERNPELGFASKKGVKAARIILNWPTKIPKMGDDEKKSLSRIWKDKGMVARWNHRGNIQVQDSLEYFLTEENLDRIVQPDYLPNNMDILRTRARTTGVVTERFKVDNQLFELCDVGGQRNERKKWISAFDGVTSVIFVAAASEYNQVLYEDNAVNRQDESLKLFGEVLREKAFSKQPFILFLNKMDLLREKLATLPFKIDNGIERRNLQYQGMELPYNRQYDYISGRDQEFEMHVKDVKEYLKAIYVAQTPTNQMGQPMKSVHVYFTNSTDSENINNIINACKQILMTGYLQEGGFLNQF